MRPPRTQAERGQALIVALGAMFVALLAAGVLAALGGALARRGDCSARPITLRCQRRAQCATNWSYLSRAPGLRSALAAPGRDLSSYAT
jgi:hypothetical protein